MSQLAHPHPVIAARNHPRVSWTVVALVVLAAAAAVLLFAVIDDDDLTVSPPSLSTLTVDGVRYDGGPEEGTAGVSSLNVAPAAIASGPVRYDGGPNEGTAGVSSLSSAPEAPIVSRGGPMGVTRYDGGPNEGSAHITR